MSELYKAIAGSPITYLAADISANQTTISITDDSALPDAPNICTIGYGENIETIRYGAKSNGVLQNVTRGLEGTPRAWEAGTEVARFYTAYDHNAIIDTLKSHFADIAFSGIKTPDVSGVITGSVDYYKSHGIVTFRITHSTLINPLQAYDSIDLFTLPEGFRPAMQIFLPLVFDNQGANAVVRVYTDGRVQILSRQSTSAGDIPTNIAFRGSGSFAVV